MDFAAHFSGGIITTKLYLDHCYPQIKGEAKERLVLLGGLFGMLPDIDYVRVPVEEGRIIFNWVKRPFYHHRWLTHYPLLYFSFFSLWYIIANTKHSKQIHLLSEIFLVATMTHFIQDSIGTDGIAWLYPITRKRLAIGLTEEKGTKYWKHFYQGFSGLIELMIVSVAIVSYLGLSSSKKKPIFTKEQLDRINKAVIKILPQLDQKSAKSKKV